MIRYLMLLLVLFSASLAASSNALKPPGNDVIYPGKLQAKRLELRAIFFALLRADWAGLAAKAYGASDEQRLNYAKYLHIGGVSRLYSQRKRQGVSNPNVEQVN